MKIPAHVESAVRARNTIHVIGPHATQQGTVEVQSEQGCLMVKGVSHDGKGKTYITILPENVATFMAAVSEAYDTKSRFTADWE